VKCGVVRGRRACSVLAAAATGALEAMGTTAAEDQALLAAGGLEPRRRLAVQVSGCAFPVNHVYVELPSRGEVQWELR
jgi:hypothetical protein